MCRFLKEEQDFGKRVIFENDNFSVVLPFSSVSVRCLYYL